MRTARIVMLAVAAAWGLAASPAFAQGHGEGHGQQAGASATDRPLCPVMEEPVDFTVKTMTADGPVYFCCAKCVAKFEQDPAKFGEKVAAQRAALAKMNRIQVSCPVDGQGVDGKTTANIDGQTVAFCCKDCQAKYEAAPGDYKAKLADSYTYQTVCPVSGKAIQPNEFTDLSTGQRIYFCCPKCGPMLLKDPAKYAPKLAEQGINIDPEKVKGGEKPTEAGHEGHGHP